MRKWIIAIAVMLAVPAVGAAATLYVPLPQEEQLVEGHTVFTVISNTNISCYSCPVHFAAAVAVLVREYQQANQVTRFPGVLWFNDQYLVDPSVKDTCNFGKAPNCDVPFNYPCSGAVLATVAGAGDPRPVPGGLSGPVYQNTTNAPATVVGADPAPFAFGTYEGSYFITDPNDHAWNVDKGWTGAGSTGFRVWAVSIGGQPNEARESQYWHEQDGSCANLAYKDQVSFKSPGDQGYGYTTDNVDGTHGKDATPLLYNAVLYFELQDLTLSGAVKNHTAGSADRANDVSGCQGDGTNGSPGGANPWPCPAGNDNREGNSHAYNPGNSWPQQNSVGRGNHGGSADCTGDGVADQNCHATANVDLYSGAATPPTVRTYLLTDTEGSNAPFYCEPTITYCGPNDTDYGSSPVASLGTP